MISTLVVCVLAAVIVTYTRKPVYEASVQIFVSTSSSDSAQNLALGNTFAQARVQSYADAATSPDVLGPVIDSLNLEESQQQLASQITADAPLNKVIININVKGENAETTATVANAVGSQFIKVVEKLETGADDTVSPVKLTVLQPASTPSSPVSPNKPLNLGLGLVIGLVLAALAAFLRERLDNTIKSIDQLAVDYRLPTLGAIPFDRRAADEPIAVVVNTRGSRAESFRQLRTNLQFVDVDNPPELVTVVSAMPGEGKSHTALNLAAALSEAGMRTCLIETDLRKPSIARVLGLVGEVGLTSVLLGEVPIEDVLQNAGTNLAVMTAGATPPNPGVLLASDHFKQVIAYIRERVDIIIFDTAPILPVADALEVAVLSDATLLAVKYGRTTTDQTDRALQALANVGVTPVGAVLSMVGTKSDTDYAYYYGDVQEKKGRHA